MSKSQLATQSATKRGTSMENGIRVDGALLQSHQSCHARAERWEYDPDWTPEQQAELERAQHDADQDKGKKQG